MTKVNRCCIVGIHDDGEPGLTPAARARLAVADLAIGGRRQLASVAALLPEGCETRDNSGQLSAVPGWVQQALAAGRRVVVVATGDPLLHGIGTFLIKKLGTEVLEIWPAVSTLQQACARLGFGWERTPLVSVHAGDSGDWPEAGGNAVPGHALMPLAQALATQPQAERFLVLTSPANSPDRIARLLLALGQGVHFRLHVASHLNMVDEAVQCDLTVADAARMRFADPNVVVLARSQPAPRQPCFGFADASYQQRQPEKGLLTKLEVRAVSLAQLALDRRDIVWDIGAGAGTVGLEAARLCPLGHVYAIEKNAADCVNARANAQRLGAHNYTLVEGRAPQSLESWPDPDAVFIGGSGGELVSLIDSIGQRLRAGGRLVMNFVTFENLAAATAALKVGSWQWEVTQLSAARSQPILDMHRLAAQNPVWIVTASKESA